MATPAPFTLPDYLQLIVRRYRIIFLTGLGVAVIIFGLSYLIPSIYQASASLIPMGRADRLGTLGALGVELSDFGIGSASPELAPAMYPLIAESRAVLEPILHTEFVGANSRTPVKFIDWTLPQGSGARRLERAVRQFRKSIEVGVDRRAGVITIAVKDRDPLIAASVANALADSLQAFVISSLASHAGQNRKFIEGRLSEIRSDLARAEEALRQFREQNLRIGNSPHLALEESRLVRAVREQEEIYLTVKREHELAKIEEHKTVPVLIALDRATPPTRKYWPRRSLLAGLGLVLGCFVAFSWQVLVEARRLREA